MFLTFLGHSQLMYNEWEAEIEHSAGGRPGKRACHYVSRTGRGANLCTFNVRTTRPSDVRCPPASVPVKPWRGSLVSLRPGGVINRLFLIDKWWMEKSRLLEGWIMMNVINVDFNFKIKNGYGGGVCACGGFRPKAPPPPNSLEMPVMWWLLFVILSIFAKC